ncbi:acyl-CoA/acyl-ACP dehydrogenase [Micromonospora sp. R77]|uniref:acyl-CoA dehydrogenase family protein n=1 Tax=Micromonospora sp. R77 TaxID=2925836 RepID=UPI001F611CB3|nr:acyl-CoA dehydrogenase family protein [Micromonospora sp. R77]MCI4066442.1 acyl-CoA/acyl-ACP dehydrogenase [Micromonospora sp. R77]
MDFALTDEQQDLRATARRYLAGRYPAQRIGALADGPHGSEASTWPELIRQGWLDADLTTVELALLAEESGYALHPAPWWSTVALAAPYLRGQGEAVTVPATYAAGDVRADRSRAGWLLYGVAPAVPDAGPARQVVVRADTPEGPAVFTVPSDAPGLTVTTPDTLDTLRPMARCRSPACRPGCWSGDQAAEATAAARDVGGTLLAAEAVGVATRALDLAVGHARTREQFGRPIGGFQAVAHQLADVYAAIEPARSLTYRAACLVARKDEAASAVAEAVIAARHAAVHSCEAAVQTLGGTGVTWEYPLHRWLRRALWSEAFAGLDPDPYATVANRLLAEPAATVSPNVPSRGGHHAQP